MPRVMLNEVKHLKMSLREILDFSPFGFTAKADASGVDLKVPSLRFVRMTLADKFAFLDNCYIIT